MDTPLTAGRVLLVVGHGRDESLCHTLASAVRDACTEAGAECRIHDLLADDFDPRLRLVVGQEHAQRAQPDADPLVHRYQSDAEWANLYVFVHPVWWFAPPAIMKGWIDRVFVDGVAVQHVPGKSPEGILHGRRAIVVQTFNAGRMVDRVVFGGLAGLFWKRGVCFSVGLKLLHRFPVYGAAALDADAVTAKSEELRRLVLAALE